MDSKQASMKMSRQALEWLHQKLIPQPLVPEVQKPGAQARTSDRTLKNGKERLWALHSQKVNIQSSKFTY